MEDVADVTTGNKDTQDKEDGGAYPFFVRSDTVERINSYAYDGEAILTSGDGVGVGKNFHYINGKFNFHQRVYCILNFKEGFSGKYIFFYFSKSFFKRVIRLSAKNSVDSVRRSMITEMKLPFPTLPEQQKIAAFLTAVDTRIRQLTRKKALLEQYKKGVMQKIFSREIRFRDDGGKAFGAWEVKKARDIFKNQSNRNHKGDLPILAITQDYGVVRRDSLDKDIQSSEASILSYKIIEPGDFVISLRSFQGGIEYSTLLGISSPAYTVLKSKIQICELFFKYLFKKESFISQLSNTVIGIREGKQISYEAFSGLKLPLPTLPEQQKIATFLTALDIRIGCVGDQIERTRAYKQGLLQRMFV